MSMKKMIAVLLMASLALPVCYVPALAEEQQPEKDIVEFGTEEGDSAESVKENTEAEFSVEEEREEIASGTWGQLSWSACKVIDTDRTLTKTLFISGEGEMQSFSEGSKDAWRTDEMAELGINRRVIGEGRLSILHMKSILIETAQASNAKSLQTY